MLKSQTTNEKNQFLFFSLFIERKKSTFASNFGRKNVYVTIYIVCEFAMDSIYFLWNYRFSWIGNVHWIGYTSTNTHTHTHTNVFHTEWAGELRRKLGEDFAFFLCHIMSMTLCYICCVYLCLCVCTIFCFCFFFVTCVFFWESRKTIAKCVPFSCMNLLHKNFTWTFFLLLCVACWRDSRLCPYCHNGLSTARKYNENRKKGEKNTHESYKKIV